MLKTILGYGLLAIGYLFKALVAPFFWLLLKIGDALDYLESQ